MNDRNVQALKDAMQAELDPHLPQLIKILPNAVQIITPVIDALAVNLAGRGALMPSALTDDQLLACDTDARASSEPAERAEVAASVRARLEKIASGETP